MSSRNVNKKEDGERLVLLDAHAIIHRAYHALPDFATSDGQPTGALYGLVSMVLKIATDLKPDYMIACYDLPKPTYRHEVYENYKAGRAKTDATLVAQLEKSKEVCEALGIDIYSHEGFEADDILGTIVEQLQPLKVSSGGHATIAQHGYRMTKNNKEIEIVIASGDMDTLQLVNDKKVQVYTLKKGITDTILYDEEKVKERFGFGPEMIPSYKGLRGDPSDNIVGVEGIGDKTATDLIKNFGMIENIYKILKKNPKKFKEKGIKPRIFELLKEKEEEARFSEMLATIRRDAPINFQIPEKHWKEGLNLEKAKSLFAELQFRTLGSRLEEVLRKNGKEGLPEKLKIEEKEEPIDAESEELKTALWVVDSNITNPKMEDVWNFTHTQKINVAKDLIFGELKKRESQFVFEEIECPLIPIVRKMGEYGVLIDKKFLENLNKEYTMRFECSNIAK